MVFTALNTVEPSIADNVGWSPQKKSACSNLVPSVARLLQQGRKNTKRSNETYDSVSYWATLAYCWFFVLTSTFNFCLINPNPKP